MDIIPEFEIGPWNAWILLIWVLPTIPLFFYVSKRRSASEHEEEVAALPVTGRLVLSSSKLLILVGIVYSFFLPLKFNTILFYPGLIMTLIGLAGAYMVILNWVIAPVEGIIEIGLYRFSRNPMYVFDIIFLLGISLVSASWFFFIFVVVYTIGCMISVNIEEKGLRIQVGEAFSEYMKNTPRWIGLPKKRS
jgi:protein-S-isoprenylcysteine O-methyltransferase Ste14